MSPSEVRAQYREMMLEVGEEVLVRRLYGPGTAVRPKFEAKTWARVMGFAPQALASVMEQGDRRLILLAEDLEQHQFPLPITPNDKIVIGGKELAISVPDDSTRRIAGVTVAYEIIARGS